MISPPPQADLLGVDQAGQKETEKRGREKDRQIIIGILRLFESILLCFSRWFTHLGKFPSPPPGSVKNREKHYLVCLLLPPIAEIYSIRLMD